MSGKAENKAEEGSHDGAKGGKNKLLPMILAVVAILGLQAGLAVGVVRWLKVADHAKADPKKAHATDEHGEEGEEEEEEEAAPKKLECVETPLSKTVSVAGSGGKRYLKATFCLEYDALKYKEFGKTVEEQHMRIEAATQKILSAAPMELVMSPAGQDTLSAHLKEAINAMLKHHKVKLNDVLVTEWLVQ